MSYTLFSIRKIFMSAPPTPVASPARPRVGPWIACATSGSVSAKAASLTTCGRNSLADARASYGFYDRDVDWEEIQKLPRWRRPLHVAKEFFWALLLKMSPARRVLLLIAFVMLVMSVSKSQMNFEVIAVMLFLLLLSLELADKVTMKRDLEIAREIQSWLVPSQAPEVAGADIAFATPAAEFRCRRITMTRSTRIPITTEKLMLVVADVAGKSVPAALLMATLQASLRTVAVENAPLAILWRGLNR